MKKKLLLAFLLFCAFSQVYGQTGFCDTAYWNHTYANFRLKVYDSCYTITGTVQILLQPLLTGDGDYHIYIQPDSAYQWMTTYRDTAFTSHCAGVDSAGYHICTTCLNVEEICKGAVVDGGAAGTVETDACIGFNDTVYLPNTGEYVQATGPFVYDTVHCWNELHPISKMILLPPTAVAQPLDISFLDGMKVFPVPANNQVTFQFFHAPGAITLIKLYDITGRQLYVYAIAQTNILNLDVSSWPTGEYMYSIVSRQQSKMLKSGKFTVIH